MAYDFTAATRGVGNRTGVQAIDDAMAMAPSSTSKTNVNASLDLMGVALDTLLTESDSEGSAVSEGELNEMEDKLMELADLVGISLSEVTT